MTDSMADPMTDAMTEGTRQPVEQPEGPERPSPAIALERVFRDIAARQMAGMPMLNPALSVEAVGFRPWGDHWLGALVTPWFMNLVLMPRVRARWQPIGERETRHWAFPAGVFEFIGARERSLGDYQACSLFSPMFEFAEHAVARDTAIAALEALFDPAHRESVAISGTALSTDAREPPAQAAQPISKRNFLFPSPSRADHGP
jgi:[NiFe] hydrogenase assembly HybE family chaperone